jgi:hypothetical protein
MHRKPLILQVIAAILLSGLQVTCTESGLYQWKKDPYQANKLTVSGTVCTDDPRERDFPVKVLFIMDSSSALSSEKNDPHGMRGQAIDKVVGRPNFQFGIITYSGKARNLIETGFTRDGVLLSSAASALQSSGGSAGPGGCVGGRCRDLRAAMSLASSIVTGDILAGDPGEVARTSYVLIFFAGGPPVPAIGRCNCRDKATEEKEWATCPWSDCEGCQVNCGTNRCDQNDHITCYPVCNPECADDYYCDSDSSGNTLCKPGEPSGTPTVPPLPGEPASIADTFTQHLAPPASGAACPSLSPPLPCVFEKTTGQGNADSCEEKTLVGLVRELKAFAKTNGAAQLQLHAAYFPDQEVSPATQETTRAPTDPFYPPCGAAADRARATRLLSEMAFAGKGGLTEIGGASAIPGAFAELLRKLYESQDPLVFKELIVTNVNTLADSTGTHPDTDGDGLTDEIEAQLKTCPSDEDTDGDGITDAVEVKLAFDPLKPNDPVECIDLESSTDTGPDPCAPDTTKTWKRYFRRDSSGKANSDRDGDGLNPCEERLLGTSDSLMDSDADGIPDKVEFVTGTNYLAVDPLQDSDFDGVVNREEVRGHTDPRSNDAQTQLDLAYRYEEVDEGIKEVLSFTQPTTITGVIIKNISAQCSLGPGTLRYTAPAGGDQPKLAWKDPAKEDDFGPAVEVRDPNLEGYQLTSCRRTSAGDCTPDSAGRFITVLVDGTDSYPPNDTANGINISSAPRNCIRFRVRNVTLMETKVDQPHKTPGNNTIRVYFSEAPKNAKDGYGIFRVHDILLNYRKGPPETRTPRDAEITLSDDDFTLFE